jgi:protein-L-isoaspartate(D-aspartate) O-methyltransferase
MAGKLTASRVSMRPPLQSGIGMTSRRTRDRMVERIRAQGIHDEAVLSAMAAVPRHAFVEEALASRAYEDTALPIGFSQTISQPYVVARMIGALRGNSPVRRVLEVGTGCGYQAAVLAQVFSEVYSIERIGALLERARGNLRELRLSNLRLVYGDGNHGLPEAAPFDGIIVAAAANAVPEALREQLAVGGRLILPVRVSSAEAAVQRLLLIERTARAWNETELDLVRFVPLEAGKA